MKISRGKYSEQITKFMCIYVIGLESILIYIVYLTMFYAEELSSSIVC